MFKGAKGKFIKKHKKSIIIVLLFIVTIIRIALISDLPFGVQAKRINDQYLMLKLSESIINGEWLGSYSESILVKGLIYPLFMVVCHYSKIPFHIFFTLIYIFSVFIVTLSLTKHLKFVSRVFLYLVLLFNPVSYAGQTFIEVYRNSLGMSFVLLFIAGLIFIYDTRKSRYKFIVSSFYLGVVISLVSNTREDGIWMMPALLIFLVVMFISMKDLKISFFSMILLLIIPLFQINSMVKYENLKYYNISYANEMTDGYYPKVFLDILQVYFKM